MATQTLEFNATQGLTLTAKLFALGSDTVVQSVSATAKTNDKGRYTAAFTDVPAGRYRLNAFVGSNGGFVNELYKLTLSSATFFPESESQQAVYAPVERSTADTSVIEFEWPISGATFANSASTCKRRFLNETGAQEEALSGAITAVSGVSGRYKLAYNIADRAADATTVIPTSVTYRLVDDAGNSGELTLVIFAEAGSFDIFPLEGRVASRVSGTNIHLFTKETVTVTISVVDAEGNAVDLTGRTLEIAFENIRGTDVAIVADGDITKSSNSAAFAIPSAVTNAAGDKPWSMRDTSNNAVLVRGFVQVAYAAESE